jgi:hypothetical protein
MPQSKNPQPADDNGPDPLDRIKLDALRSEAERQGFRLRLDDLEKLVDDLSVLTVGPTGKVYGVADVLQEIRER